MMSELTPRWPLATATRGRHGQRWTHATKGDARTPV